MADPESTKGTTPLIEGTVHAVMPDLLRNLSLPHFSDRERDVVILGSLTALSSVFPWATGNFRGDWIYPNLNLCIVAPPASGKGHLKYARRCMLAIDDYIQSKGKHLEGEDENEIKRKRLFIPGDTSSAAIIKDLKDNNEVGLIFETEIDVLANSVSQDWGSGFYSLIRYSFHHEPYSFSRKTNREYIDLKEPRLSLVLSGTLGQFLRFIPSASDGTFSRILYYTYSSDPKWKDLEYGSEMDNVENHFKEISSQFLALYKFYENRNVSFSLTGEQIDIYNKCFTRWHEEYGNVFGDEAFSFVRRYSVACFRIAFVLTLVRIFENYESGNDLICCEDDFHASMRIIAILLEHASTLYQDLPEKEANHPSVDAKIFFDSLKTDQEYSLKDYVEYGKSLGYSPRSISNWLSHYVKNGMMTKTGFGKYMKPS